MVTEKQIIKPERGDIYPDGWIDGGSILIKEPGNGI